MGGQGSGRPPSVETIIARGKPPETPIGTGIYLPNYSGLQAVKKTDAAISTAASGNYYISGSTVVDSDKVDGLHASSFYLSGSTVVDSDKVDGSHASAFEAANANIQTHVTGTGSPHTWAGINKTVSSIADITTKSHTALSDIGTNTHANIDTHIADTSNPHGSVLTQTTLSGSVIEVANAGNSSLLINAGSGNSALLEFQSLGTTEAYCWHNNNLNYSAIGAGSGTNSTFFTDAGSVGINTASPDYLFHVEEDSGNIGFCVQTLASGDPIFILKDGTDATNNSWSLQAAGSTLLIRYGSNVGAGSFPGTTVLTVGTTSFNPSGGGSISTGDGTNYWNDISYKTLTDRGCLGSFDEGVELQDGSIVSDIEALKSIKTDPAKSTVYGVPRFDYKTMPKAVYKPAPPKDPNGEEWLADADGRKYYLNGTEKNYYEDGAETTALISILIGAIKELDKENTELKKRITVLEG